MHQVEGVSSELPETGCSTFRCCSSRPKTLRPRSCIEK